ncbi:MAG: Ig-like domain-containing protein [Erysipelotrichales bacterium]|nr:Ig-like domain-containing protein [Erysipelotrichales bacterium]
MKKKIILLPLMLLALVACGQNNDSASTPASTPAGSENPGSVEQKPSEVPSVGGDSTTQPEEKVDLIEDVLKDGIALDNNAFSTKQYTIEGIVTGIVGNSYYIQDGEYAFYVYNKPIEGLKIGDKVRVVSQIQNYNGLIETYSKDASSSAEKIGEGTPVTPVEFASIDEITQMDQSKLVTIKGLGYVSGSIALDKSSGVNFNFGGTEVQVRMDKYLDGTIKEEIAEKLNNLTVNDTVDFTGVNVGWYNGVQFALTSADSIEVHQGEFVDVTSIEVGETLEVNAKSAKALEINVLPANATNKELEYESASEAVATVKNGVVTGVSEGETDITIKSVSNPEVTASVHVTVTAAKEDTDSVTYDFSSINGGSGLNATQLKELFASNVTGEDIIESVNNAVKVYKADVNQGSKVSGVKLSTSSEAGSFTITTTKSVTKVIVAMHAWQLTNSVEKVTLDINGVSNSTTSTTEAEVLTYEIDAAFTLTFAATKRPVIASITLVY